LQKGNGLEGICLGKSPGFTGLGKRDIPGFIPQEVFPKNSGIKGSLRHFFRVPQVGGDIPNVSNRASGGGL